MKYLSLLIIGLTFLNVNIGYSCSPPAPGPVDHQLTSSEKNLAYIEMGRETAFGKKNDAVQPSGPETNCRWTNNWRLSYSKLPETSEANKNFNEAVKNCTRLFQLYMISPQKLKININANQYDDSIMPHCALSPEA
jgi:hypothetical protein